MRRPRFYSLIGVLTLTLWGFAAAAQTSSPGPQLGKNLGGELCRADGPLIETTGVDIFCGDLAQSVGRLRVTTLSGSLPSEPGARRADILARAKAIAAALLVSEQLSCDSGQLLDGTGEGANVLFLCVMQSSSWPRIVIVSGFNRKMYQADGLPGMLPVLGAAVSAASGHRIAPAELAAGQRRLEGRLPAIVFTSGTADFARYTQAIELARAYSSDNDFGAAEATLRNAVQIDTQLFGPDSPPVGLALMELALQVSNQGRFDEAAGLFQRAAPIIQASLSADARARLNSYLALDAANQREFAKALAFARQATADRRAEVEAANGAGGTAAGFSGLPPISSGELAHSLRIEAEMALRLDDIAGAQAAAEEALWIISLEPGLALWWRADVVFLMGEVNERQGRIAAAESNFLEGLDLRQKLFGESAPLVLSQLRIGKFYNEQERYPEALSHFRAAMSILEKDPIARSRVVPDQLVPFIAAANAIPAGPQQRAMLDAEIFRAMQMANSDVADQAVARTSVRQAAGNPVLAQNVRDMQDAQHARDRLRIDIAAEFAKPDDERSAASEAQLAQKLALSTARADELLARVQETFPDYARLSNPGPAELADVRAQLGQGEALLSFVVGFRGGYGLLATAKGLTVKRLDVTSDSLNQDIAVLRRAFTPQLGELPQFSFRDAYTLYAQLLGPFASDLKGVDHLIVAPGPVLANLPFSLLVSAVPDDTANYSNAAWLIRTMAISQVPSPRAFVSLRQTEGSHVLAPRPFLGVGNPLLTGANEKGGGASALDALALSCREASPMPAALLRALSPLPDTAKEVNDVARALGGDADSILLGANADEMRFRGLPLDQYRIVYFATHGLLPGELHCQAEPGLVLSPPAVAASNTDMDGLLEASEVSALRFNADLVVLSACNTAAAGHGHFGGDALEGLADAFFNAGARAVLASHWEIPSAATTLLMTNVFRRYAQDPLRGLAEALRQSQLDSTRDPATAHPFYWAAFTLIGAGAASSHPVGQQANGGFR